MAEAFLTPLALLANIVKTAPDALIVVDKNGKVVFANEQSESLFGYPRDELLGQPVDILLPLQLHEEHARHRAQYAEQPESRLMGGDLDLVAVSRDGREFPVEVRLSSVPFEGGSLVASSIRDISERVQAEEEIRSLLVFERLVSELSSGFVNLPENRIDSQIQVSLRRIVEFMNVDRGTFAEVFDGDRGFRVQYSWAVEGIEPLPSSFSLDRFPWAVERVLRGELLAVGDLNELPLEANTERATLLEAGVQSILSVPLLVAGEVVGALGLESLRQRREWPDEIVGRLKLIVELFATALARKRTILLQQAVERESRRLREHMEHVGRVSALGELVSSVAHEINQPLAAILSNAQAAQRFLDRNDPDLDEIEAALEDIVSEDRRAGEVISHLRSMVRRELKDAVRLDLASLMADLDPLLHHEAAERGIELSMEVAAELPLIEGDKVLLQQVLLNLVLNSFDAVEQGAGEKRRVDVSIAEGTDGGSVEVKVSDTGTGLNAGDEERIFEAFVTSKKDGLGMGLSIARTVVTTHGGTIWAENNEEGGATFRAALPAAD